MLRSSKGYTPMHADIRYLSYFWCLRARRLQSYIPDTMSSRQIAGITICHCRLDRQSFTYSMQSQRQPRKNNPADRASGCIHPIGSLQLAPTNKHFPNHLRHRPLHYFRMLVCPILVRKWTSCVICMILII